MTAKVAVVHINNDYSAALRQGIELVGGLGDLHSPDRAVTIKIGLFDPRMTHHSSIETVGAIAAAFDQAPRVFLAESDNYCAPALERLERFSPLCDGRVILHSLSNDPDSRVLTVAGGEMAFSNILFKPNVFVSTHVLRTFAKGSILKNLFGCTPVVKKGPFHKKEIFDNQLADIAEAVGGIDLAVMDGTFLHHAASGKKIPMDLLIVGRDAVAVEVVGFALAGLKPEKNPTIAEFARRGLGVGDLSQIEIVGVSAAEFTALKKCWKELQKQVDAEPRPLGISKTIDLLAEEGWLDAPRTAEQVAAELKARGVGNATKQMTDTTLKRRVGKTLAREKIDGAWHYFRKQG